MKVYVVTRECSREGWSVEAVFAQKEKAEKWADSRNNFSSAYAAYSVEEWEVEE